MKNKKLTVIIAVIVLLIAAVIALVAMLTGVFSSKPTVTTETSSTAQVASSTSTVASSSSDAASTASQNASSGDSVSSSESNASTASSGEAKSTTVTFNFFVHGEPIGTFEVPNAAGKSVLEAMQSNSEIRFNFNEEDGVIDNIFDNPNNDEGTWVYLVNGQIADRGVKSQKLEAGDSVQWYFGTIDEIPTTIIPAADESAAQ